MLTLIKNGTLFAPARCGQQDILIGGGKILKIAKNLEAYLPYDTQTIDAAGQSVFPGLIDGHVHILGGGGEGGYATRTPEIMLSQILCACVTSLIGCIGTDGTTRTMPALVAKARGLSEEGVCCKVCTGSYQVPVRTLTGSVLDDILLVENIVGCGEIAISDHRSSQPTFSEFAKIVADARVGGILSGKAGIVSIHMGDGPAQLAYLARVLAETEIPAANMLPTHINRSGSLMRAGIVYAREQHGFIDLTTSSDPAFLEEDEVMAGDGFCLALEAGVSPSQITFSSDGQGSMPIFDSERRLIGLGVGQISSLYRELRGLFLRGVPLETALLPVTANPAKRFKLAGKGEIRPGADADLVIADTQTLQPRYLLAGGRVMMEQGRVIVQGTFEPRGNTGNCTEGENHFTAS